MSVHVVVGAGPVGRATAELLAEQDEDVVLATRTGSGPEHPRISRVRADASSPAAMVQVSAGARAIYNCAGPAYHRWVADWPPIAAALLEAAAGSGAVLVTAGNLYGYGKVHEPMTEDLPLAPAGPKGRVRAQMWRDALEAHRAGRVRTAEVRGADYLCPGPGSHLGDRVVPQILRGRRVRVMPSADAAHTWTAVEDVARLLVTVAAQERAWGRAWHVPSNLPRTQREAVHDLCRAAGVREVDVAEHPGWLLRAVSAVNPAVRELAEVGYQLQEPFVMDSTAAQRAFGLAPTPWPTVLQRQIAHYRGRQ